MPSLVHLLLLSLLACCTQAIDCDWLAEDRMGNLIFLGACFGEAATMPLYDVTL